MELRQLQHLPAVVEEGPSIRAAARVHTVRSSLSASLLGLEKELGTDLFSGTGIARGPLACIDEILSGDVAVATLDGAPTWQLGIATRDEALRRAGRAFLDAYRRQCRERLGG